MPKVIVFFVQAKIWPNSSTAKRLQKAPKNCASYAKFICQTIRQILKNPKCYAIITKCCVFLYISNVQNTAYKRGFFTS